MRNFQPWVLYNTPAPIFRASRKRENAIAMLNSFQTNDFVKGLLLIFELPDGADTEAVPAYVAHRNWKAKKEKN